MKPTSPRLRRIAQLQRALPAITSPACLALVRAQIEEYGRVTDTAYDAKEARECAARRAMQGARAAEAEAFLRRLAGGRVLP